LRSLIKSQTLDPIDLNYKSLIKSKRGEFTGFSKSGTRIT